MIGGHPYHLTTFKTWFAVAGRSGSPVVSAAWRHGVGACSCSSFTTEGGYEAGMVRPGMASIKIHSDAGKQDLYTIIHIIHIMSIRRYMKYCSIALQELLCTQHSKPCPDQTRRYGRTNLAGQSKR